MTSRVHPTGNKNVETVNVGQSIFCSEVMNYFQTTDQYAHFTSVFQINRSSTSMALDRFMPTPQSGELECDNGHRDDSKRTSVHSCIIKHGALNPALKLLRLFSLLHYILDSSFTLVWNLLIAISLIWVIIVTPVEMVCATLVRYKCLALVFTCNIMQAFKNDTFVYDISPVTWELLAVYLMNFKNTKLNKKCFFEVNFVYIYIYI